MRIKSLFRKAFRYQQKPGWCGPAVIQMALASGNIKKTQKDIAKEVYLKWWGTTHGALYAYLSRFFKKVDFKTEATLTDIKKHLRKGHFLIANWWDDLDKNDIEDGHYSSIIGYDEKRRTIILGDPSNNRGIWEMEVKEFSSRWYDTLDTHGRKRINGWLLWLDPNSRIKEK